MFHGSEGGAGDLTTTNGHEWAQMPGGAFGRVPQQISIELRCDGRRVWVVKVSDRQKVAVEAPVVPQAARGGQHCDSYLDDYSAFAMLFVRGVVSG